MITSATTDEAKRRKRTRLLVNIGDGLYPDADLDAKLYTADNYIALLVGGFVPTARPSSGPS